MQSETGKTSDALIEEYLEAIGRDWVAMDFRTFSETVDVFSYDPLIAEPWTRLRTIPMLDAIESAEMSPKQAGSLLHNNPSAIRNFLNFDLLRAKYARFGVPVYMRIFKFYSNVLSAVCLEDIFVKNKKNIVHKDTEIAKMVARCEPANPEIARKLGKLANACYNLSYGLYSDMNCQLVYDNLGPYYQPDGRMFAVKIFHNLKPTELWSETSSLPVKDIDIGALFEGVTLEVDMATHPIYSGDQINGLRGWWCVADGRHIDDKEIDTLRQAIEQKSVEIYMKYKALNLEAKKELYWHQHAWSYKKLFDILGLDWRPSQEIVLAGRGKPLFQNWQIPEDKNKQAELFQKIWDPRIEIPKEAYQQ